METFESQAERRPIVFQMGFVRRTNDIYKYSIRTLKKMFSVIVIPNT